MNTRGPIAVSGANGFIGKHLCRHLLSHGHEVIAIARQHNIPDGDGRTNVALDLLDPHGPCRALDGCDAVIHLAGRAHILDDTADDPLNEFRKANVEATLNLLRLAAKSRVRRFVFVSSIGVNGNRTQGQAFTEADKEAPQDLYAISKFEAEQEVRRYAEQAGLEFVIVRPTLVFGPDAPGNFALLLKLASMSLPLPFGMFSARRNLISVWNLVDLLHRCAMHPAATGQVFLAADKETLTLKDIFIHLRIGMNRHPCIFDLPPGWMSKIASITGKMPMFKKLTAELRVDPAKAATLLEWQAPHSAHEALERTGREYLKNRK